MAAPRKPERLMAPGATRSDEDGAEPPLTCRQKIDLTLNDPSYSRCATLISNIVTLAILVSMLTFVISSLPDMEGQPWLDQVEVVVVVIFTLEYVSRFVVCM